MSMSLHSDSFRYMRRWTEVFLETGTHVGGGVLGAVMAGFKEIYTCELDPFLISRARDNMGTQFGRAHYYAGSSSVCLPKMLKDAGVGKFSILLDAHATQGTDPSECPLRRELEILRAADRHDHLIAVDDYDLAGTDHLGGMTASELLSALKDINSGYYFERLNGVREKMLLVAVPPGFPF